MEPDEINQLVKFQALLKRHKGVYVLQFSTTYFRQCNAPLLILYFCPIMPSLHVINFVSVSPFLQASSSHSCHWFYQFAHCCVCYFLLFVISIVCLFFLFYPLTPAS